MKSQVLVTFTGDDFPSDFAICEALKPLVRGEIRVDPIGRSGALGTMGTRRAGED